MEAPAERAPPWAWGGTVMQTDDRGGLARVARVLGLIQAPPNQRTRRLPGDAEGVYDFGFDGGAATQNTGGVTVTVHFE